MVVDTGAYPGMGGDARRHRRAACSRGRTRSGALEFEFTAAVTNKATYVAYRGPWAAETFVRERMIDIIARELGVDPLEVRRRNLVTQGDEPRDDDHRAEPRRRHGARVARAHGRARRPRRRSAHRQARGARRGPLPRHRHRHLHRGGARARAGADGGVMGNEHDAHAARGRRHRHRVHRQMPHGQGHETTLAQIAADEIGVPFEQVRDRRRRQRPACRSASPVAAASATMAGGAVAAHGPGAARRRCSTLASHLLEASADDLEIVDGTGRRAGRAGQRDERWPRSWPRREPGRCPTTSTRPRGRQRLRRRRGRVVGRHALRHRRGRHRDRARRDRALRRGRGLRRADQPGHRRRPGARRRRPGHRRRAARALGLRRRRPVPRRHVHGLPAADDHRDPAHRDPPPRDGAARSRRELPRRRRGRDDRVAADAVSTPSRTPRRRSASPSPSSTCRRSGSSSSSARRDSCPWQIGRGPSARSVGAWTAEEGQPMLLKWWWAGLPARSPPSGPSSVVCGPMCCDLTPQGPAGRTLVRAAGRREPRTMLLKWWVGCSSGCGRSP